MTVHVLPAGPIRTNAYLLTEPSRGEAVLIDAPGGVWEQAGPLLEAQGCRLTALWITHGHWDHTQGAAEVVRRSGAWVAAHADGRPLLETPEIMSEILGPEIVVEPVPVTRWVGDGDRLEAAGIEAQVRAVPGHCPGSLLFYVASLGAAFVGDALFAGSVGRTDLPGGDFPALERSIRTRIYTLPGATVVHPGHGPTTTVERERLSNPHVRG